MKRNLACHIVLIATALAGCSAAPVPQREAIVYPASHASAPPAICAAIDAELMRRAISSAAARDGTARVTVRLRRQRRALCTGTAPVTTPAAAARAEDRTAIAESPLAATAVSR